MFGMAAGLALVLASPGAAVAGSGYAAHSVPAIRTTPVGHISYSANWAGYVASGTNGAFDQVSATWVVPALTCSSGQTSYSASWVGLDGWNSSTVEQTGTDANCRNGTPTYDAWYEAFPKLPTVCPFAVAQGDTVTASVTFAGGRFTVSLVDGTSSCGTTFLLRRAQRSSAEVIVEAPSSNHSFRGILPLADFQTASFGGATVDGESLAATSPIEVVMTTTGTSAGTVKADPEDSLNGASFSVTWFHA